MVRAVYSDGCDSDFSCKSAEITTGCSKVFGILKYCKKIIDGPPSVYRLPLVEIQSSKDDDQKTRKCRYGNSTCLREKTVLMVGPRTGGKTTLINGLVNHSLGVKWEHEYRLKISDEPEITSSSLESPTEWITSYKLHPVTTDTDFILNIIDTPSFHEGPESVESNKNLVKRLKFFLSTRGPKGMNGIDAVCFVSQANPVTFSGIDKAFSDILDGIVSLFGDNMHGNIIPMLTFADGKEPSVLKILSTVGVPTQRFFVFNSSTLFPPYTEDALLGKTSWKLSSRGFEGFLNHLSNMKPCPAFKTTPMTTTQPNEKWQQEKMTHLQENRRLEINVQLMNLANVQSDRDTVKSFAIDKELNNTSTYDEKVYRQEIPLKPGTRVTNCIVCHTTCHFPCTIPINNRKKRCDVMKKGNCTKCHQKCVWHLHRNDTFRIIKVQVKTVTRTYADIKAKYEFNVEENVSTDAMLQAITRAFVSLMEVVISLISKTVKTSNSLQKI
ncbi:uncharacterized protein LOC110441828 [Mizuhopecten yessoensis]|uniref:uncharacterized protein LOC110441828 n=1 Tax=Mizuhopecten yessoensis TaxID=6573 RepID=UPI000B45B9D0|nr:uncharacterized protein LOC110441828 [Mizuhopecten yessoensis]